MFFFPPFFSSAARPSLYNVEMGWIEKMSEENIYKYKRYTGDSRGTPEKERHFAIDGSWMLGLSTK